INNYASVKYPGDKVASVALTNPYALVLPKVESECPVDRRAISANTTLVGLDFTLIRAAADVAGELYVIKNGQKTTLTKDLMKGTFYPAYYYEDEEYQGWDLVDAYAYDVNKMIKNLGVSEGDKVGVRVIAVPEYYGMQLSNNARGNIGNLDTVLNLADNGTLGEGAQFGLEFTVDNTAPEIISAELNEDKTELTVTAKDNQYIAAIVLTDVSGQITYDAKLPAQTSAGQQVEVTFDISDLDAEAIVIMAGDYAANEDYKLALLSDGPVVVEIPYFKLKTTDNFENGKQYILTTSKDPGVAEAMTSTGYGSTIVSTETLIIEDEIGNYIPFSQTNDAFIWTAEKDPRQNYPFLKSNAVDGYMSSLGLMYYMYTYSVRSQFFYWGYDESDNYYYAVLGTPEKSATNGYGTVYYTGDAFAVVEPAQYGYTPIYVYELSSYQEEIKPNVAKKITVDPENILLIEGVNEEADITYSITPNYLEDKTVKFVSEDESIASVDETGHVTGISLGSTVIKVISNATPEVYATVNVNFVKASPINLTIYGAASDPDGDYLVSINLSDMSIRKNADIVSTVLGGGRSGNFYFMSSTDAIFAKYDLTSNYSEVDSFEMVKDFLSIDCASLPTTAVTVDDDQIVFDYYEVMALDTSGQPEIFADKIIDNEWKRVVDVYDEFTATFGTKLVGITLYSVIKFSDSSVTLITYMTLSEDGHLGFLYAIGEKDDTADHYLQIEYEDLCKVDSLVLTGSMNDYSLMYSDETKNFYLADATTNSIYEITLEAADAEYKAAAKYIGTVEGVTRIGGLYNNGTDATVQVMSTSDRPLPSFENAIKPTKHTVISKSSPVAVEIPVVEATIPVEAPAPEVTPSTSAAAGGITNAKVSPVVMPKAALTGSTADDTASITYTEDIDVGSGTVSVTYDPDNTKFVGAESDVDFFSVNDDGKGTVLFSFAAADDIKAGSVLATFKFENTNCDDTDVTLNVKERNVEEELDDSATYTIEGVGHDYQFAEMVWGKNHKTAYALFVCKKNSEHELEIPAEVTVVTTDPTETEPGTRTYTATVVYNGEEYTATYTEPYDHTTPDMGDHSNNALMIAIMAGCVGAIVGIIFVRKKRENK
ncbi:MAG: Ig-like domain-containing protein, partial [Erysipelotrichaceae bacterium]|nr:Ig-like domain-containing protein [Erysipelotrichaceae bacterium]